MTGGYAGGQAWVLLWFCDLEAIETLDAPVTK